MKTKYKFIYFEESEGYRSGAVYIMFNKKTGERLAEIWYYREWKKYIFAPGINTLYDEKCLADIIHFLGQLNNA